MGPIISLGPALFARCDVMVFVFVEEVGPRILVLLNDY